MKNVLMLGAALAGMAFAIWTRWCMWVWFAVPAGAPDLPMLHVAGLLLLISPTPSTHEDKSDAERLLGMAYEFAGNALMLVFAYGFSFAVVS